MAVKFELEAHSEAERLVDEICRGFSYRYIPLGYHEGPLAAINSLYTLPAMWIRDRPDGFILGSDFVIRCEVKAVSSKTDDRITIPLMPWAKARCEFQDSGDPTLYCIHDPRRGRVLAAVPGMHRIQWTSANTTDRWGVEYNARVKTAAKSLRVRFHTWPWLRSRSGDPWLRASYSELDKLPELGTFLRSEEKVLLSTDIRK